MNKYLVTYNVNLIHEIEIVADNENHARELFEDMYRNEQDSLPEYHDIDHEIVDVERQGNYSFENTHGLHAPLAKDYR